jgi:RING finger protein 121/175
VIVGKKDCCPYCSERVDLKALKTNKWNAQHVVWAQLLHIVRMVAAWNPLIMLVIHGLVSILDRPT